MVNIQNPAELILDDLGKIHNNEPKQNNDLLLCKSVNKWNYEASSKPIPKQLFGELWFENEISILFASSNVGKSLLAVQIANSISNGYSIEPLLMQARPQTVLYFDFELSDMQFLIRYSFKGKSPFQFSENFNRVQINYDTDMPDSFEKKLTDEMNGLIAETGAKVIIIDNLSFIKSETEKGKEAKQVINSLKSLKNKLGLSILILAHTPKRDNSRPITANDLAGSAVLSNFIDSSFAIGTSAKNPSHRYIKQIKVRNCANVYHEDNVLLFEIMKDNDNFTRFQFLDYSDESEHLISVSKVEKESQKEKVMELKKESKSLREIEQLTGVPKSTINRWLKQQD
jgi:RecA-family ATPase